MDQNNKSEISQNGSKTLIRTPILVTGSYDGTIVSWDTSDKVWSAKHEYTHKYPINRLAISEDGTLVAAATTEGVYVYKLPEIKVQTRFDEKSNVTSVFFQILPNLFYYTTENGELFSAEPNNANSKTLIYSNGIDINCGELSPNQSEVYFGDSNGNVKVIDVKSHLLKSTLCGNKNAAIRSLAISPICSILAVGDSLGDLYWWSLSENSVT